MQVGSEAGLGAFQLEPPTERDADRDIEQVGAVTDVAPTANVSERAIEMLSP